MATIPQDLWHIVAILFNISDKQDELMADVSKLKDSVTALTAAVDAAIAAGVGHVEDPAVQASIDAAQVTIDEQAAKLKAVVPVPPAA